MSSLFSLALCTSARLVLLTLCAGCSLQLRAKDLSHGFALGRDLKLRTGDFGRTPSSLLDLLHDSGRSLPGGRDRPRRLARARPLEFNPRVAPADPARITVDIVDTSNLRGRDKPVHGTLTVLASAGRLHCREPDVASQWPWRTILGTNQVSQANPREPTVEKAQQSGSGTDLRCLPITSSCCPYV
jgi:hypothetical protein